MGIKRRDLVDRHIVVFVVVPRIVDAVVEFASSDSTRVFVGGEIT